MVILTAASDFRNGVIKMLRCTVVTVCTIYILRLVALLPARRVRGIFWTFKRASCVVSKDYFTEKSISPLEVDFIC
jgi:hypothetical protein